MIWIYAPITINGEALSSVIYEIVPGFIVSTVAIVGISLVTAEPNQSVQNLFKKVNAEL